MSLAMVLFPPPTDNGLHEWSLAHYLHHLAIIAAVKQSKGITLPVYQIWPMSLTNIDTWLENHQLLHNEMNAVFKNNGNDLSSLDWKDEKQREGFFYLNFQEHRSAGADCGVPI